MDDDTLDRILYNDNVEEDNDNNDLEIEKKYMNT